MSQYKVMIAKVIENNEIVQITGLFDMDEPTMDEIVAAIRIIIEEDKK